MNHEYEAVSYEERNETNLNEKNEERQKTQRNEYRKMKP